MMLHFRRLAIGSAVTLALFAHAGSASALGVFQAYEAALKSDPTYLSAIHENEAGQQNRALGRSYLLPNLQASYSKSKNRADQTYPVLGQLVTTHPEYDSEQGAVQLRQPIINLDGLARYGQGVAQANFSDFQFEARRQDLLIRVMSAYADAKFAEDQLLLATAQRNVLAEQKKVNERMFAKGEGTKTDVLETEARFDLAEVQVLEAENNLTAARKSLAAIVGMEVTSLDNLSPDFRVMVMEPAHFEDWKAIALEKNPEIVALKYSVEAAQQAVNVSRSGHVPKLDFVGTYSKGKSETLTTLNQDTTNRSVGLQLVVPLFSGGSVSAATTQAVANRERAKADLDGRTGQILVELHKQYDQVLTSTSRISAMVKSVDSASALIKATEQSVKGGVRINLDVLNAQQQFYSARKDLAQARYMYLLSYLRLRSAAGILGDEDLRKIAMYFSS